MAQVIIIVGAARSGTKYLRDILSTAPNATRVPYDINYIWRFGNADAPSDALQPEKATAKVCAFVQEQIFRLSKSRPSDECVVIEKTVGTSLRPAFAAKIFPEARFVHLIRDGRSVTESSMRQWQEPPDWNRLFEKFRGMPLRNFGYVRWFAGNYLKGLFSGRGGGKVWGPRYAGIDDDVRRNTPLARICARQWLRSVETSERELAALAPEKVLTIRYEDLVAGTGALEKVAQFCGLENTAHILAQHSERVDTSTDAKWKERMSEQDKAAMLEELGPMLSKLGYSKEQA